MTPQHLIQRLADLGFVERNRSLGHLVMADGCRQVVVPDHSPLLSSTAVRMIEGALEPYLGPDWLNAGPGPSDDGFRRRPGRLTVHAVFLDDGEVCNAAVVEEPAIVTFGRDRDEARQRLLEAIESWFGADHRGVELLEAHRVVA
jgi:hypothetical protein